MEVDLRNHLFAPVLRIKQQGSSGNMSPISYVAMMVSGAPRPASFERMWHM